MIALFLATRAYALDPMCGKELTLDEWTAYMDAADAAFAASELSKARVALDSARELLPCLAAPADLPRLARYGQQRAILAFLDQDETAALKWGLVHRYADPAVPWPFPEDHPLVSLLTESEDPPLGKGDGAWVTGKGTSVFLNGALVLVPEARAEVPQLVQVFDKNGVVIRSFWQDGAAFSADLVGPYGLRLEPPEWWTGPVPPPPPEGFGEGGKPPKEAGDVKPLQVGVEVGFPTGARVELHPADTLRVGVRLGGTLEPLDLGTGAQGTFYGAALGGMAVAGPVGAELSAGLAYTWGGDYDLWKDEFDVGHALPLVGLAGTVDLGDRFRVLAGGRAAFGDFVWLAPEATFIVLF